MDMVKRDAQQKYMINGYCEKKKKNGFAPSPNYCSLYCLKFMTEPADGYKRKTHYENWQGTGTLALNPVHPKIDCDCEWCGDSYKLSYDISCANKSYCGNICMRQATQGKRSKNKKMLNIANMVRIMRVLRYYKTKMSANDISNHMKKWFGRDCSSRSVSNMLRYLCAKNIVSKSQSMDANIMAYKIKDERTSLKQLFY